MLPYILSRYKYYYITPEGDCQYFLTIFSLFFAFLSFNFCIWILTYFGKSNHWFVFVFVLVFVGAIVFVLVGVPEHAHPSPNVAVLIFGRRSLAGSLIGGIRETQEMLDFCAERGIVSDIEMIPAQQIDAAYDRMQRSDVKYRFVIDMATLKAAAA